MKMLIGSLKTENSNIYMDLREDHTVRSKCDVVVHLMNNYGHIGGYSLIRINYEGLLKFKRISNVEYNLPLSLDHEKKLCISGVDLI